MSDTTTITTFFPSGPSAVKIVDPNGRGIWIEKDHRNQTIQVWEVTNDQLTPTFETEVFLAALKSIGISE